jgi:hypothetical protein
VIGDVVYVSKKVLIISIISREAIKTAVIKPSRVITITPYLKSTVSPRIKKIFKITVIIMIMKTGRRPRKIAFGLIFDKARHVIRTTSIKR